MGKVAAVSRKARVEASQEGRSGKDEGGGKKGKMHEVSEETTLAEEWWDDSWEDEEQ